MEDNHRRARSVIAACTHLTESLSASAGIAATEGLAGLDMAVTPDNVDSLKQGLSLVNAYVGRPIEVRYHTYFSHAEFGHLDSGRAADSLKDIKKAVRAISAAGGEYVTVHIGFNEHAHGEVPFSTAVENLRALVKFAARLNVTICVENLRRGLTSVPELYIKLIEQSNASSTFDIGHALSSEDGKQNGFPFETVARLGSRVKNAHVYQAEDDKNGHMAPCGLSTIAPALDSLRAAGCGWWVIELGNPDEIRMTKALLDTYFHDMSSDEGQISAILAP